MKKNYKTLRSNIPSRVKVAIRTFFDILWSDSLYDTVGNKLYGKTTFEPDQIILNKDQADKDAVLTTVHEFYHALDHAHDIRLTEAQVVKLEKCYPFIREFVLTLEGMKK